MLLVTMAGLPGAGKSAVAERLARALPAVWVSVDPIEAAIWRAGVSRSEPTGLAAYVVAETVAEQALRGGLDVVLDAVNDVEPAREQWRALARRVGVAQRFVEVRCTDVDEHRRRLAGRVRDIEGFPEPTWASVQERRAAFSDWDEPRVVLDSVEPLDDLVAAALAQLAATPGPGPAGRS